MEHETYFVEKHEECRKCNGAGYTINPIWEEYFRIYDVITADIRDWFGYHGYHHMPPEEIKCENCDGRGWISYKVPLEEALVDMGILKDEDISPPDNYADPPDDFDPFGDYEGLQDNG